MSTVRLTIYGGTRPDSPRLCDACTRGMVMSGRLDSEELTYCGWMHKAVPIHTTDCNRYEERGKPTLWDMREIAWVLHGDSKRQKIGFLPASEWEQEHSDEELLPDYINRD